MTDKPYPGDNATPAQVHALADEYRRASQTLLGLGRSREPLTRAPFRLAAIQAIELYLNAFLLRRDYKPSGIRALQHDLGERAELAFAKGLTLRKKTAAHLVAMSADQEYVATRYGPELAEEMSEINRLMATLEEIANKVAKDAGLARTLA